MKIILEILQNSWVLVIQMAPYLWIGFIAAGILHVLIPVKMITNHLGKENIFSVLKATLFGIPIPVCSCGVLPIATSLRKSGASRAATLSFLIITPVTGVDSLIATWSILGVFFTVIRLVASLIIGFASGFIMIFIKKKEKFIENNFSSCSCCSKKNSEVETSCCGTSKNKSNINSFLNYTFVELPSSLAGSLFIGFLLAGLITTLLPPELINKYLSSNVMGILVSILIAIPLYVCATSSIPIATAMILSGFTPGAALAFLIAGPATNTIAIIAVKNLLGKKALAIYLINIFIGSFGFGLLIDSWSIEWNISQNMHNHLAYSNSLFSVLMGAALVLIVLYHLLKLNYKAE